MRTTFLSLLVTTLLVTTSTSATPLAGSQRVPTPNAEQVARIRVITSQCVERADALVASIEADASARHTVAEYAVVGSDNIEHVVTKDDFHFFAFQECMIQTEAEDPVLAPLLVDAPPGTPA